MCHSLAAKSFHTCVRAGCTLMLQVAAPLLRTLAAMHAVGVTHRDVKLENIFMDASGAVKLGDFDLAVFHHEAQVGLQQSAACFCLHLCTSALDAM